MKIGFLGDGIWAHRALEEIIQHPTLEIVFISARFKHPDKWLKNKAKEISVPFELFENVNSKESLERIKAYKCDVIVSMSFEQILKKELLELTPMGAINCHASALPFYRGRNPINWAIINDEKELGITVHHVDEGIDTGDIIVQHFIPIKNESTYAEMLKKAHIACASSLVEALLGLESNTAKRIKQSDIHPTGFYCGRRRIGDETINWSWGSRRIYNFIRAISLPGPCARTMCETTGKSYGIVEAKEIEDIPNYIATAGEVVGRTAEGVVVKTGDSCILITKMLDIKNNTLTTECYKPNLKVGTRLKPICPN